MDRKSSTKMGFMHIQLSNNGLNTIPKVAINRPLKKKLKTDPILF